MAGRNSDFGERPDNPPVTGEMDSMTGMNSMNSAGVGSMVVQPKASYGSTGHLGLASFASAGGFADHSPISSWDQIDPTDITITAKKAGVLIQKSALASATTLVERDTLIIVIEENHRRFTGCLMLPVTLLFFVFYACAASMHEDITMTHLMESPFRDKFMKMPDPDLDVTPNILPGIVNVDDVWTFLNNTFIPTFFTDHTETGIPLSQSKRGRPFMYNNLVGAVQFIQQRSVVEPCDDETTKHMLCYPQGQKSNAPYGRAWNLMPTIVLPNGTSSTAHSYYRGGSDPIIKCDEEGFTVFPDAGACPGTDAMAYGGRRMDDNILRDELQPKMPPKSKEDTDKFKFYLFQGLTEAGTRQRVNYLKERGYIDHQTTELEVKALYLNNELDIPRLDAVNIIFYVSRGGGVYVQLRMEAIFLKTFSRTMTYFWDFMFFTLLVISTCYNVFDFLHALKRRRVREHFTVVNCVTWLTIFMGWFNAMGLLFFHTSRRQVKEALEQTWVNNNALNADDLHEKAQDFVYFAQWYRVFVADAHVIFMMRCFIALQWQPRLAVVTHTLMETSVDLIHFLIVLVPTFIAFAIAGNEIFGRRVSQFSTIEGAICVCFKIAMESEFDWQSYSEEDFLTAMSWVGLYVLLVVLLMLNMVLAIIMDVYSVIRLQAGNSETVWANIMYLFWRAWLANKWVQDKVLLERVQNMPRTVGRDELVAAIPEMTDYQIDRLMRACNAKAQAVMRMGVHDSYTAQMTAATKIGLDGISRDISQLKYNGWMGRGVEAGSLSERMLAQDVLQSAAVQTHWMSLMQVQIDNLKRKTQGAPLFANLQITFFYAAGLPSAADFYATCNISGRKELRVKTRTKNATDPQWNEEHVLEGYETASNKGLQFNVFQEGANAPVVAANLAKSQFFPDGFEGDLNFPGGCISVRVEVTNPDVETSV